MHNDTIYTSYNANFITGNSDTFNITTSDSDIKVDVLANKHYTSRIWGQIKDHNGNIIPEALVRLVKTKLINGNIEQVSIGECISDLNGFYQFMVNSSKQDSSYKIIVSKNMNTYIK